MKSFLKVLLFTLTVAYPFVLFFGRQYFTPLTLSLFLLIVLFMRAYLLGLKTKAAHYWLIGGGLIVFITYLSNNDALLLWYPAMVCLAFLVYFVKSLYQPQSAIEQLARLHKPDLPSFAVQYTRKVTIVWAAFFFVNGTLSIITVLYGDDKIWALYNGLIAYILMALLFSIEWLYRQHHHKKHAND